MAGLLAGPGRRVFVAGRTVDAQPGDVGLIRIPFDAVDQDLPLDRLPDVLHGLAYCPGTIRLRPFRQLKRKEFVEDFEINLLGAVSVIQAALPLLQRAEPTASVVLFSTVAVGSGMPYHASVASAKGAVEGLTRSLAAELAPKIRVNAVAPSLTDTPLAARLLSTDDKRSEADRRHPLGRVGRAEDIARWACALLDEENGWITGQVIPVDGGMGALRLLK
jgi:NAD(P)-dependent dehydrogenase (short-subunit alcohol dehydrogenase family)